VKLLPKLILTLRVDSFQAALVQFTIPILIGALAGHYLATWLIHQQYFR
jgi:hypothetical protein